MENCEPFLVVSEHGEYFVIIRLGSGAMVYFDEFGKCTYTRDSSPEWADSRYTVVSNAKIDIKIDVKFA
jgi:hypothetical protein